jgi:hypothetical protein
VGETVTVKTRPQVPGDRRLRGVLTAADQDGLTLEVEGGASGGTRLAYSDIDKARTVFVWGPERGPGGGKGKPPATGAPAGRATETTETTEKTKTQKRKQVATP